MACGDEVRGQRARTPVPTPALSSPCRTSPRMAVSPLQKSPCQRPCHPHWKRPRTPDFEKTGGLSQSTSGRYVLCTSRGLVWVFDFVKSWSMSSQGFTLQLSFSKATPCFMYHQVFDSGWGDSMALVITSSTVIKCTYCLPHSEALHLRCLLAKHLIRTLWHPRPFFAPSNKRQQAKA